jgi:hypothetical protein
MAHNMRFLAKHIDLLVHSKSTAVDGVREGPSVSCIARDSLQYVLDYKTAEGPYLPRTVCAMIYWSGLMLLKVSAS